MQAKITSTNIVIRKNRTLKMYQFHSISRTLQNLRFNERTMLENKQAEVSKILKQDVVGKELHTDWDYSRILGQLNLLEKLT